MKELIYEICNNMGIEIVGFTDALQYDYLKQQFIIRREKGYDCEFEENDLSLRMNVNKYFPECKSIVSIAIPYAKGYRKLIEKDKGLISVSSNGKDYHVIVRQKLEQLAKHIEKYLEIEYKICVDTSPLIDREICKNAGIGEYGKNHLLINNKHGSFIFLGSILLDKKIENINNNLETKDICKECKLCIDNCPNNAIKEDGQIDTKRCISYLTQTRNYIPIEYREKIGNSIYGCDICQLVCPKNRKVLEQSTDEDYSKLSVDIIELIKISNKKFKLIYGEMAGSWRGKNIWKRNAIISAANLNYKKAKPLITNELNNESEMIKIYSAWALLKLDKLNGKDILRNKLKYENISVKNEYEMLLEKI